MRPSKIEWIIAIILFLFLFASWGHGDTQVIVGHEIDFADSLIHGEFANFYQRSYDRARSGSRDYPYYDLLPNLVFGIWGLPLYLLVGTEYDGNFFKILYGKSLFFFVFLICAFLVYKMCREFEVDDDKSQWAAFIYFTSSMAINSICLIGNCDTLGAALILAGILAYIRHKDFQCFLWFMIAFPFKQHAAFIYLPLLLLRDKNIFRVSLKLIIIAGVTLICNIPIYNTPGAAEQKMWFMTWMAGRFMVNTVPFLSGPIPIFLPLYGMLCALCYITNKYTDKHTDENTLTLVTAALSMIITLSSISSNPNWYLQIAPYLAIGCVYYAKAAKDIILFETIGSLAMLGYNYIQFNDSYKSLCARNMLLYKLIVKPVSENSTKFTYENNIVADLATIKQPSSGSLIRLPKAALGSIYTVCMIIMIFFLFRASNTDTHSRINFRPYALTRMALNMIACYIPVMIFVMEAMH